MLDLNKAYNPPCVPGTARDHLIGINGRHKEIIWLPGEPFGPSRGCCASPRNSERTRWPDPSSTPRESSPLTGDSAEFFGSLSSRGYRSPCSLRASLLLGAVLFDGQLAEFVTSTSMGWKFMVKTGTSSKRSARLQSFQCGAATTATMRLTRW